MFKIIFLCVALLCAPMAMARDYMGVKIGGLGLKLPDNYRLRSLVGIELGRQWNGFSLGIEIDTLFIHAHTLHDFINGAFVNIGYEIPLNFAIRPFVLAGTGIGFTSFTARDSQDFAMHSAYHLGGGLSYTLSPTTKLSLGYQFTDFGDFTYDTSHIPINGHAAYMGVSYYF